MRLFDAHNHLQDDRFAGRQDDVVAACREAGIVRMVVNGSCEADWPAVASLADRHPDFVLPAFGLHPWYLGERTPGWRDQLRRFLERYPKATVGEVGLDRWILECPPAARAAVSPALATLVASSLEEQGEVFAEQLAIASEFGVAASIHCLQAWGAMHDQLRAGPCPAPGFLLHSYGGPAELLRPLSRLGAYFSFPGYFLHERKTRQREVFRHVPADRLLIETDAPDQRLPAVPGWKRVDEMGDTGVEEASMVDWPTPVEWTGPDGRPLNHPVNLRQVYAGLSAVLQQSVTQLAERTEANFERLFGGRTVQPPR